MALFFFSKDALFSSFLSTQLRHLRTETGKKAGPFCFKKMVSSSVSARSSQLAGFLIVPVK